MVRRARHRGLGDDAKYRAFDELYESTFDQILAYCRRRCLRVEDAQDAAAETYLTAWRKIEDALEAESPRAWLYRIAFRVTANQRRGRDRYRRLVDRLTQLPHRTVVDSAEDAFMTTAPADAVYAALATLPPMEQELIRLSALEGFSHIEIATIVGLSTAGVTTRLYRARQQLRTRLETENLRDISARPDTSTGKKGVEGVHEPPTRRDGLTGEEEEQ